jgi:uncharacterized protein YndB with AHSA1/START domain
MSTLQTITTTARSADGTVEIRDGRHVLRFERRLDHPIDRVWAALTEPDELAGWLAAADIDLVEGGPVELRWLNTDEHGEHAVLQGIITELDPPRVLEYDSDAHGDLRWELRQEGDGSALTFLAAPPCSKEELPRMLAGWHFHLDHLADALAGDRVDWSTWDGELVAEWNAIHDRYRRTA